MRTLHPAISIAAVIAITITTAAAPQNSSAAPSRAQSAPKPAATAAFSSSISASSTTTPGETTAAKLPVRRVILYKTGVGYFEHLGHVRGNESVRVDFTSGQLNDVLQSLTVLDLNGGRISGVNYNSEAPLSERLGTLRLPLEEKTDLSKFYGALRGARLQIRTGATTVTGRLLSVERKTRVSGGTTLEVDLATIVSDSGEVRSIELTPAVTVQLAEPDLTHEVGQYLHLLASVRQQDLRRMTLATEGTGDRQLYVSYISEVPIWKTTYRIVLPRKSGEEPLLQGWAIVDNTIGEDWNNVELSLVAGAPQSFIQQLSQPLYGRRPVVPLSLGAQLTPQTHEGAMLISGLAALSGRVVDQNGGVIPNVQVALLSGSGEEVAATTTDGQGNYAFGDLPTAVYRLRVQTQGFQTSMINGLSLGGGSERNQDVTLSLGSTTQIVEVSATASSLSTDSAGTSGSPSNRAGSGNRLGSGRGIGGGRGGGVAPGHAWGTGGGYPSAGISAGAISDARRSTLSAAQGSDLGDLFEYKLKDRVTIHKNESSLVPIVQAHVQTEKVSLWNPSLGSARPLRALWLTNSSPLTLDGGSFSVLEDEAFSREGFVFEDAEAGRKAPGFLRRRSRRPRRQKNARRASARHEGSHHSRHHDSNLRHPPGHHLHRTQRRQRPARAPHRTRPAPRLESLHRHAQARRNHRHRLPLPSAPRRQSHHHARRHRIKRNRNPLCANEHRRRPNPGLPPAKIHQPRNRSRLPQSRRTEKSHRVSRCPARRNR